MRSNRGSVALREAIVDWLARRYGLADGMLNAAEHVVSVSGTREGLFMCALVFTPAEKAGATPLVLMPNPFYQCYAAGALAAGADPVYLPTRREHNFLPDLDAITEDIC